MSNNYLFKLLLNYRLYHDIVWSVVVLNWRERTERFTGILHENQRRRARKGGTKNKILKVREKTKEGQARTIERERSREENKRTTDHDRNRERGRRHCLFLGMSDNKNHRICFNPTSIY